MLFSEELMTNVCSPAQFMYVVYVIGGNVCFCQDSSYIVCCQWLQMTNIYVNNTQRRVRY